MFEDMKTRRHIVCLLSLQLAVSFIFSSSSCKNGFFRIGQMTECQPLLSCQDIIKFDIGDLIGYGAVKHIYKSTWHNTTVALVFINSRKYFQDFMHGLEMLRELGPSEYVVQLIGFCLEAEVYVTEYHSLGSAQNFHEIYPGIGLCERFRFCINYVKIIDYFHQSPSGKRVMCDSSSLNKTLEQYLITSSHKLIVNDVDALPVVNDPGVICGSKELKGNFVAPEQRWPHKGKEFSKAGMKPYDEKVDIWKIPNVCNYFLGLNQEARNFRFYTHSIHKNCKKVDPKSRPSASSVLMHYEKLYEEYCRTELNDKHKEL